MDKKEARDYVDRAIGKGFKVKDVRAHLIKYGVDPVMVDDIINEIMFNAPSTEELSAPDRTQILPSKEEVFSGEELPKKFEKPPEKKESPKIINPKKIRRKKIFVNSMILVVSVMLLSAAGYGGYIYWLDFVEKQRQEYLETAITTNDFTGDELRSVVLKFERGFVNSTIS